MSSAARLRRALGPVHPWVARARRLARSLSERARRASPLWDLQRLFALFPPDSEAGESLFRLAEALERTPDAAGRRALVRDLALPAHGAALAPLAVPLLRTGLGVVAGRFVFADAIGAALARASRGPRAAAFSFDMLGEGARTAEDAARNEDRYLEAIEAVGRAARTQPCRERLGVSVKLSAIHPRHDASSHALARPALLRSLERMCHAAACAGIGLTIDAEESERVSLAIDLVRALAGSPELRAWDGLGLAVQAYRTGAEETLAALLDLAEQRLQCGGAPLRIRLVKGAYWDAEVKRGQELGLECFPVHTDKRLTDLSYLACARLLLSRADLVRSQFATHNPITIACVLAMAEEAGVFRDGAPTDTPIECQRLHGMGEGLEAALREAFPRLPVRLYAPVGGRGELLAYLVRRLLENAASTSYLRRAAAGDLEGPLIEAFGFLHADAEAASLPPPQELPMQPHRSARGRDLGDSSTLHTLAAAVAAEPRRWKATPLVSGEPARGPSRVVTSPAGFDAAIGEVVDATPETVEACIAEAFRARTAWAATDAETRASRLERLAELLEADTTRLMALCVSEAGKTLPDALADVREAVDFCRYYAHEARRHFGRPLELPGPVGERNVLTLHGRGVFACISPWNFPVAIFTGQVAAALAAGNTVIAKPAEQTPLTAYRVAQLILEAGVPPEAFQFVPGDGDTVGRAIVQDRRIAGVAFTGSNETARAIQRGLVEREGPIVPLIAETGGLNAMIVDSTALPEQVVDAVVSSAFRSAGQRCSSLRMLYLQREIADHVIEMLRGALAELRIGDPADLATDVGPVIDEASRRTLADYVATLRRGARLIGESSPLPKGGYFVPPVAFEVRSIDDLPGERFGPILHVARFAIEELDRVIDDINAKGYGLTMGVHTRVDARAQHIRARAAVGNLYVNRNMIGAVVGVQPFGGEGLSGTGPKAGGPHYLPRFATERVYTVNTAAAGGDIRFLTAAPWSRLP